MPLTRIPKENTGTNSGAGRAKDTSTTTQTVSTNTTKSTNSAASRAKSTQTPVKPATANTVKQTNTAASRAKSTVTKPVQNTTVKNNTSATPTQTTKNNLQAVRNELKNNSRSLASINVHEAENVLQKQGEAYNIRKTENPDYEFSLYQVSNGDDTFSGSEYKRQIDELNAGYNNLIASSKASDEQYKQDGDYDSYYARYTDLLSQQEQLAQQSEYLKGFSVTDFNKEITETYDTNKARMDEITSELAKLNITGGPSAYRQQLNDEYAQLKSQNDELQNQVDDIRYLNESMQLEFAKENASDEDLALFARYVASEDDSAIEELLKKVTMAPANMIHGLSTMADIATDLGGEISGSIWNYAAEELHESGMISDATYNNIAKEAQKLKEFSFLNDANPMTQMLRDFNYQMNATIGNNPNLPGWQQAAVDIIGSALEDYIRRQMFGDASTWAMAAITFSDTYMENKAAGHSDVVSLLNAVPKAAMSYWSENLSSERYFDFVGSVAGRRLENEFFADIMRRFVKMVPEEMLEEGVEYIGDYAVDWLTYELAPGYNAPNFVPGDLIKNMWYAGASSALTALFGAGKAMVFGETNSMPEIKSVKEYNQVKTEYQNALSIYEMTGDLERKAMMEQVLGDAEKRMREFEAKSKTNGMVEFQDDLAEPIDEAADEELMKSAETPDAKRMSDRQIVVDRELSLAENYIRQINEYVMEQNGVKGLSPDEYANLSDEERAVVNDMAGTGISYENYKDMDEATRQEFKQTTQALKKSGMRHYVERLMNGQNALQSADYLKINSNQSRTIDVTKLASLSDSEFTSAIDEIINSENEQLDVAKNERKIKNSKIFGMAGMEATASSSAVHEMSHFLERSGLWKQLRDMVKSEMGDAEFNKAKERLGVLYSAMGYDSDAEHEAVAFYVQQHMGDVNFLTNLAKYHTSAFERLRSDFGSMVFSSDTKRQFENLFARAYEDAQRETDRQMKELVKSLTGGYIGDNFFSRNKAQLGLAEYKRNGKKLLETFLENQPDLSPDDRKDIMAKMEEVAKVMENFQKTGKFPEFSNWQNTVYSIDREGNFSVVITNGDYDLNIDFSTVCKKRQMMDKVLNALSKNGYLNGPLTRIQLAKIREIIEKEGLEVACGMCFVDAKRFNQGSWAGKFETKWNGIIDQIVGLMDIEDVTQFDFVAGKSDVSEAMANIDFSDPRLKEIVDKSQGSSEEARMIKAIINDPSLRGYVSTNDLYGSDGFKEMKNQKPALYKLANASGGSSKPKLPHTNILYTNEIEFSDNFNTKDAENVGGVRVQSFSDFMVNMVFDYTQMFADMEAKKLKGHSYTKVKEYALFFGKTGMKINLSIIPAGFDPDVYTAEEIKDIKKNNKKLFQELKKNAGLKANGDYMFDKESFGESKDKENGYGWKLAIEMQNLDGYDKNVGTICVGVSDNHIWKMLDDDNVCMIIPYHRSGISPLVADKMGISTFNDYTLKQNTRFKKDNGRYAKVGKGFDFDFYRGSDKDGVHYPGMIDNNYDARATADSYLAWCDANSYLPKFDAFRSHRNYYKLLVDFRAYDKNGNVAPQEAINISKGMDMKPIMIDPEANPELAEIYGNDIGFNNVLQKGLEVSEKTEAFQNEKLGPIMDEVVDTLGLKKTQSAIGETNNQYSISPETEKAYDEAVRNNDMETAQRLVDEAARRNGYDIKAYHGTNEEFTKFSNQSAGKSFNNYLRYGTGFYFAPTAEETKRYGKNVMSVFLSANRLLDAGKPVENEKAYQYLIDNGYHPGDAAYAMNYGDRFVNALYETLLDKYSQGGANAQVQSLLREFGYDGVVGFYGANNDKGEVVVFDPSQIKSADPVTYDDDGNVIPLSKRFDQSTDDIRYEIGETNDLNMTDEEMGKYMKQSVPTNKKVQENTDETLAKVLSETPEKERKSNLKKWARDLLRFKFADRYTGVVDLAESKGNERLKDLTDWAITSNARASNTIYKGRFDQNGKKKIGKSLTEILGTLPKADKQLFFEYMYHWRNVDDMSLNERFGEDDKPVFGEGFTADDSRQRIAEIEEKHPEFKKRAEEIWKYVQEDLKMQIGGLISQDGYNDLLKKRPHYVPIERNVEKQKGNSSTDANKLLKKMKGSNLDILALDETLKRYTQRAYRTFDRNNLFSEIAKTLGVTDNLENESIDDVMENDIESAIEADGNYTLTFYRNGQKMSVPVDKVIYDAFKSGPQMNEDLKKVADKWAQINQVRKNLLTAWNPFFAIRNASKDLQDAGWNTKYAKKFPAKYAEAWAQIANRGEFYQQFANLGGGMSNYSARDLADAFNEQQSDKGMKKVVNRLLEINDDVETAPRLAEFMASLEAGNSVEKAMRDAAEITTNFKRGGTISKAVDKYGFTFLNASIQGYDKHIRDWKSNVKKARKAGIGGVLSLMAKLTLASGLPLRLLQDFLWRDDKDYEELSDYIKDKYYILHKTKDGKFIRINKGRIATFYQTLIMNAAETIQGKVNLWDAMVDDATSFVDNIAPNNPLENNIFAPISQTLTNKTWYGDEIVSSRLQDYNEWDQYDESTDELSKAIGRLSKKVVDATGSKAFGLSPKKVNYLLDQYSGVIGDVVLPALTLETETSVENPLLKGPATALLNSFTSDPVLKNQNVADFYALNESLLKDTKNKDATDEQILSSKYMSSVSSEMGKLYAQMHEIQGSDLSNKEKMEQTRELKKQINDLARNALGNYDNMDITGRYATVGGVQYYQKDDGSWVKPSKTSIENLNNANLSDEDRDHYYTTWGDITDIRKQIKDSTPEGQKADYTKATIDAISKSGLSYKGKNTLLDSYYDSKLANHVNSMSLSDEEKYNLKVAAQLAEGQKDEKGKTISNSKARATADAYRELGLLDDVLEYIKDNNISPSEMGLSKTVYKELMGGTYQDAYNKASKSSSKKKSSKSSSRKKSSSGSKTGSSKRYGGSGTTKGGRMSTIKAVTPKKIDVKQNNKTYLNAYQNIMNRGSKNVSSGTSGTVTCPRCGNRVSSATGRCPICGAKL